MQQQGNVWVLPWCLHGMLSLSTSVTIQYFVKTKNCTKVNVMNLKGGLFSSVNPKLVLCTMINHIIMALTFMHYQRFEKWPKERDAL